MTTARSALAGHWRIVEADVWDRAYLDLCGPASLAIGADGEGRIAFCAMQAGLDIVFYADAIDFDWCGFDEMDEAQGDGTAELQDDGSITIDFRCRNGDEAVLKAVPTPSSAAC